LLAEGKEEEAERVMQECLARWIEPEGR